MDKNNSTVAIFADHESAEAAVKMLATAGFDIKNLSVVGKGYHTDEKVVGFYNMGDRVKFWGTRGAFWGGLWGLFFGGLFLTIPVVGHVVVLGYLATIVFAGVENAIVTGGLGAIGAALYSLGVPKDSVLEYESAVTADNFLVAVHGTADDMIQRKGHPSYDFDVAGRYAFRIGRRAQSDLATLRPRERHKARHLGLARQWMTTWDIASVCAPTNFGRKVANRTQVLWRSGMRLKRN